MKKLPIILAGMGIILIVLGFCAGFLEQETGTYTRNRGLEIPYSNMTLPLVITGSSFVVTAGLIYNKRW